MIVIKYSVDLHRSPSMYQQLQPHHQNVMPGHSLSASLTMTTSRAGIDQFVINERLSYLFIHFRGAIL